MQNNRTLAQRTLLNWRFWAILPATVAMLPLGLVSLAFPFNINWYARAVNWAKTKNPYNPKLAGAKRPS